MTSNSAFVQVSLINSLQSSKVGRYHGALQQSKFISTKRLTRLSARKDRRCVAMTEDKLPPVDIPLELQSVRVLGLGSCGIDILARIDKFPKPDDKIRTTSVSVLGGGNTANTLTAVRRLGVKCSLVSKVGDDMYGNAAVRELREDGIDTSFLVMKNGVNTSFTYVLVDTNQDTRTCIATPSNEDLLVTEVNEDMLQGITLVILDGRHTLAALQLAKLAKKHGIPILLDVERDRPYIRDLLPFADFIITNSVYPFVFSPGASGKVDAMQSLLEACNAKFVITTLGESGSTMVQRKSSREKGGGLKLLVQSKVVPSRHSPHLYEVLECPAWPVQEVVDTTGAGDAFIGGIVYGIVSKMDHERMLCLASCVAAAKIEGVGSRTTLPRRENIARTLLVSLPVL